MCIAVKHCTKFMPLLTACITHWSIDLPVKENLKLASKCTCYITFNVFLRIYINSPPHINSPRFTVLMQKIKDWFCANFLSINVSKTFTQHYSNRSPVSLLDVRINGIKVKESENVKYLGVYIDSSLKFSKHIGHISALISRNIGIISRIRFCLDKKTTLLLYNSLVLPHLNYCCLIWGINYQSQLSKIVTLQKRAVRLIEHVYPPHSSEPIFKKYKIVKLGDIAKTQMLLVMHKFITKQLPSVFGTIYECHDAVSPHRRLNRHLKQPFTNRNYRLHTTTCLGPKLWNEIMPAHFPTIQEIPMSKITIKNILRKHFVDSYGNQWTLIA